MMDFHLYHISNDYKYANAQYNCILCDYCSGVYCDCQIKVCSLVCSAPSDTVTDYKQDCPYFTEIKSLCPLKCCSPPDYITNCLFTKSPE